MIVDLDIDPEKLLRIGITGVFIYVGLVFLLRVFGKRTLSDWNSFDFVITVAFGSTFATVLLSQTVSIAEGLTAFTVLILLQFIATWLSVRSEFVTELIKSKPTLIFYRGNYLFPNMKKQRVTESEVMAAIREKGIGSLEETAAVVLETDGSFSVLTEEKFKAGSSTYYNVKDWPQE